MNPDHLTEVYPGERRPECFGHWGYGAGYTGDALRCHVRVCPSSDQCYEFLRKAAEQRDPEQHAAYMEKRRLLREEGLDGQSISFILATQGFPPTTQEGVLANTRRGQLDSGLWRECRGDGCHVLVRVSHHSTYCHKHEETDGNERELQARAPAGAEDEQDRGAEPLREDAGAGHDPASPTAGRFGSATDAHPPLQP